MMQLLNFGKVFKLDTRVLPIEYEDVLSLVKRIWNSVEKTATPLRAHLLTIGKYGKDC